MAAMHIKTLLSQEFKSSGKSLRIITDILYKAQHDVYFTYKMTMGSATFRYVCYILFLSLLIKH